MDRLQTKAADCVFNEYDRRLMDRFIHELDDEGMVMLPVNGYYCEPKGWNPGEHKNAH